MNLPELIHRNEFTGINLTEFFYKNFLQEFSARIFCKNFLQEFSARKGFAVKKSTGINTAVVFPGFA